MRKQGHVIGTQGPPPFTPLPTESRATNQRNNSQIDKKDNFGNASRQKQEIKTPQQGDQSANNSNAKNSTHRNNKNSGNNNANSGKNSKNSQTNTRSNNNTNDRQNSAKNSDNKGDVGNKNNRNRAQNDQLQHKRNVPQKDAKNSSGDSSAEYKPKNPVNETAVTRRTENTRRADSNKNDSNKPNTNAANNSTTTPKQHTRVKPDGKLKSQPHSTVKYAPKTHNAAQDRRGDTRPAPSARHANEKSERGAYYQAINPLLQALVTFRPAQTSESFISLQVTLTRVVLSNVTFMSDNLVCLALSDALTVLQVCCELNLLADIVGVTPDNAPLVLQTAYQTISSAVQPVYHLVAPVQLNHPVNMIAGYIMLADIEL